MPALKLTGIVLFALLCHSNIAVAQDQLCNGSLGDNIFREGDFGSGRDVIFPVDPGLAPGYMYTTYTPVHDGQYTLTNDIGQWWDNWPTWLRIQDRSVDRNGYMMVVNASFEPGIFYEQMVDGVCENTLYEFSADVINLIAAHIQDHHDPDISFLIDGKVMFNTGNIRQDEEWKTVGFTFRTRPEQTSVRLTLRNNAPGGTGNDLALDNISFRACGPVATIDSDSPDIICEDEEFPVFSAIIDDTGERFVRWQMRQRGNKNWGDMELSDKTIQADPLPPGTYEYRYVHAPTKAQLNSEKCRAASEVRYLVVKPAEYRIVAEIDNDEAYVLGNKTLKESGTYRIAYPRFHGCDSVVVLSLTVAEPLDRRSEPVVIASAGPVIRSASAGSPLKATVQVHKEISCYGESGGALRVVCDGGNPPYKVNWSSGGTKGIATNLSEGTYSVTVSDSDGSEVVATGVMNEPDQLVVILGGIVGADPGKDNGQASIKSDLVGLTYKWDHGRTTASVNDLSAGIHTVTVTNANGCEMEVFCRIPGKEPPLKATPELTAEALKSGAVIRMERLQFEADSSRIKEDSYASLMELYQLMNDNPDLIIEVGGHTNGLPAHDYCDRLSNERAQAVAEWIVQRGIDESRVFYKGYGKRQPVASNSTREGRKRNQRVEVKMVTGKN